jgi:hypothetical protein
MPTDVANGYRGGNAVGTIGFGDERFIRVYNETGGDLAAGSVVLVSYANSSTAGVFPRAASIATDSVGISQVGVVANYMSGTGTIKSATWGWVQIKGYCPVVLSTDVTAGHALKATNASVRAVDEAATTVTALTFAIAKEAVSGAGSGGAYLLGVRTTCS